MNIAQLLSGAQRALERAEDSGVPETRAAHATVALAYYTGAIAEILANDTVKVQRP